MSHKIDTIKDSSPDQTTSRGENVVSMEAKDFKYTLARIEKLENTMRELMMCCFKSNKIDYEMKELLKKAFKVLHED